MKKRVAIGLSGGIDSSFAAYLLTKQGFDTVGFSLKFYPQENRCCDLDSLYQAKQLCSKLGITHQVIDVSKLFKEEIINYFIQSYLNGLTPNPCAFCNRLIKFGYFFDKIRSFDFDYLATGHYARIESKGNNFFLKKAKDERKSQEYFLSLIRPEILANLIFPLGDYLKQDIKEVANQEGIIFKPRQESQDVCFIKDKTYAQFIQENIAQPQNYAGSIKHINGETLGSHNGIYNFTYGQREGLGISWKEPLYVADINYQTNTLVVGEKEHLYKDKFKVRSLNWFFSPSQGKDTKVRIRYNCPLYDCNLKIDSEEAEVFLKDNASGITPGQIATFYSGDTVLGGGIIAK